ncbi:alanine:cation symporter family protein, partial [Clostridium sp. HCS.1]
MDIVWHLADVFMGLMAIINLIAIVLLSKIAINALEDYKYHKSQGIQDPVFYSSSIPELEGLITEWPVYSEENPDDDDE